MDALLSEVERNLDLASSTKRMLDRERDMFQGAVEERVVFPRFHTDAWDAVVNDGALSGLGDAEETVARCYMHLKEVNEVLDWFTRHGNGIAFTPLLEETLDGYGRKEVIGILRETCDEAEVLLRDARRELEAVDL